eukprot:404284-Alexandrium_andersonii.AAC.1
MPPGPPGCRCGRRAGCPAPSSATAARTCRRRPSASPWWRRSIPRRRRPPSGPWHGPAPRPA